MPRISLQTERGSTCAFATSCGRCIPQPDVSGYRVCIDGRQELVGSAAAAPVVIQRSVAGECAGQKQAWSRRGTRPSCSCSVTRHEGFTRSGWSVGLLSHHGGASGTLQLALTRNFRSCIHRLKLALLQALDGLFNRGLRGPSDPRTDGASKAGRKSGLTS